MRFLRFNRVLFAALGSATLLGLAQPAFAGFDEALKALQSGDFATSEKELQVLIKERDPRAQFLAGLYIYGNPESKMYDPNKATPMLLDAAERGYVLAMLPVAGAYAEGARLGAPQAQQVADRFHLLMNLRAAVERSLEKYRAQLTVQVAKAILSITS